MKSINKVTSILVVSGFLFACSEDDGSAAQSSLNSVEKQYLASCEASSVDAGKCKCMMGVYKEIGLDLEKLSNPQTAVAESQKITPEASQKLAQCML